MAFLADRVPHSVDVGLDLKSSGFPQFWYRYVRESLLESCRRLHLSRANVNEALKQGLGRIDTDSGGNRMPQHPGLCDWFSLSIVILLVGADVC